MRWGKVGLGGMRWGRICSRNGLDIGGVGECSGEVGWGRFRSGGSELVQGSLGWVR